MDAGIRMVKNYNIIAGQEFMPLRAPGPFSS
jgi:hypothetical protein